MIESSIHLRCAVFSSLLLVLLLLSSFLIYFSCCYRIFFFPASFADSSNLGLPLVRIITIPLLDGAEDGRSNSNNEQ